jgi:hypothetical protein
VLKRKKSSAEEPSERTRVVGITYSDDQPVSLNWDPGYSEPIDGFVHCIWFIIEIKEPNETGFHKGPEGQYLGDLGDDFEASSHGRARLVGSLTVSGTKQFCFYARDVDWIASYETTLKTSLDRKFGIKVNDDPSWEQYKKIRADAIQADSDRQVWTNLDENGADFEQPHQIDWFVYFPTEGQAGDAERILVEHEYQVELRPTQPGITNEWGVIATLEVPLSLGYVSRMSAMFVQFALDQGGTYDGWGAVIEPRRVAQGG